MTDMRTMIALAALGLVAMLSTPSLAAPSRAGKALLTKNVYRTPALAARCEAANQMTKMLQRVFKPAKDYVVHASDLRAFKLSVSPKGNSLRFLVASPGDIPGDYKLSVRKVQGGWKAYKVGTPGAQ
jgi:hypothetical protein